MTFRESGLGDIIVATSDSPPRLKKDAHYVGDGTADEVQINAAIEEAYRNASTYGSFSGGHVRLGPGTYNISYPIDMCGRVWLQGSGRSTVIRPNGSNFQSAGTYDGAGAIKLVTTWSTVTSATSTTLTSAVNAADQNKNPFATTTVGSHPYKGSWIWCTKSAGGVTKGRMTTAPTATVATVASWDNGTPEAGQTWWIGAPPTSDGGAGYTDQRIGERAMISDLCIVGNANTYRCVGIQVAVTMQNNKDGLTFTENNPDMVFNIRDVWIDDCAYEAVTLDSIASGDDTQSYFMRGIAVWNCGGVAGTYPGIRVNGPDGHLFACDVGRQGAENSTSLTHHGYWTDQAPLQLVDCKAWNCKGDGFHGNDRSTTFSACVAQDNNGYGFYLSGSRNLAVGCYADGNNRGNNLGANSAGFYVVSAHTMVSGCVSINRSATDQKYGYRIADVPGSVIVGCIARNCPTGIILDGRTGDNLWKSKIDSVIGTTANTDGGTWAEPTFASNGLMFSGNGAPTSSVPPVGTLYLRRDGAADSQLYVHVGSGTWERVATAA